MQITGNYPGINFLTFVYNRKFWKIFGYLSEFVVFEYIQDILTAYFIYGI